MDDVIAGTVAEPRFQTSLLVVSALQLALADRRLRRAGIVGGRTAAWTGFDRACAERRALVNMVLRAC
jgi:hypothetical protein